MGLIDDWGATPYAEKRELEQRCERMGCGHMRYLHGTARTVRAQLRYVAYEAGKCVRCRCVAFQDDKAITFDEIMDVADALGGESRPIRLMDYEPWQLCNQIITRWVGGMATIDVPCGLKPNHDGAHEAKD